MAKEKCAIFHEFLTCKCLDKLNIFKTIVISSQQRAGGYKRQYLFKLIILFGFKKQLTFEENSITLADYDWDDYRSSFCSCFDPI